MCYGRFLWLQERLETGTLSHVVTGRSDSVYNVLTHSVAPIYWLCYCPKIICLTRCSHSPSLLRHQAWDMGHHSSCVCCPDCVCNANIPFFLSSQIWCDDYLRLYCARNPQWTSGDVMVTYICTPIVQAHKSCHWYTIAVYSVFCC